MGALLTVAAAATIAAISFHIFGNHLLKSSSSAEDTEKKDDTPSASKEESNEVRDFAKDSTESTASQSDAEEISSPKPTQKKPTTIKGKKWRDRLAAKKEKKATGSSQDTEPNNDTNGSSKEDSNEVTDPSKDATESTASLTNAEEIASPTSTTKKPTTAKGKKWKDRLAAKKDKKALELKLSKDYDANANAE